MRSILFFALLGVSAPGLSAAEPAAAPAEHSPATVRVTLPDDAGLTVDGRATRSTSAQRLFVTPPLEAGKRYRYTFSASVLRDGKLITVEQEVFVRAGQEASVSLDVPAGASGSSLSPGSNNSSDGSGNETRTSSYGLPEPPAAPPAGLYLA